jgi:hypothetical protein
MIKQFKPIQDSDYTFDENFLILLIVKGEFKKAVKICKKYNLSFDVYNEYFPKGVKKLILSHRSGELLSFIYNNPNILTVDKVEILKNTFENGDMHGFVKNCFRFKIYAELKDEIDIAISQIRPEEAVSWRDKFSTII